MLLSYRWISLGSWVASKEKRSLRNCDLKCPFECCDLRDTRHCPLSSSHALDQKDAKSRFENFPVLFSVVIFANLPLLTDTHASEGRRVYLISFLSFWVVWSNPATAYFFTRLRRTVWVDLINFAILLGVVIFVYLFQLDAKRWLFGEYALQDLNN